MCNCNNGCGGIFGALENLFDTSSWNNGGCGCSSYANGFINGVNTANSLVTGGCGCNGSDVTGCTSCGNQPYDAYYARQYALYPYGGGCGCGN